MRRDDLAAELVDRTGADGYVLPDYGGYCFAGVPGAVYRLLGAHVAPSFPADAFDEAVGAGDDGSASDDFERVVVVLVDGFGYDQWRRLVDGDTSAGTDTRADADTEFLSTVERQGTVTPLTSIFPSETAAAIPTYHTARYPHEHGVHGWYQYAPEVDDVFLSLPFTTVGGRPMGEAYPGFSREDLFLAGEHYDRTAAASGVETRKVVPEGIAAGDDRAVGYDGLDGFASELGPVVADAGRGSVTFAYLPQVDAVSHRVGTRADEYRNTLSDVDDAVSEGLAAVDDVAGETLVVVTADHGHVDTDPATNVDIRDDRFDPLWELFERRPDGRPVPPSGSPRQLHLHLRGDRPEDVESDARRIVQRELDDPALVLPKTETIDRELWGPGEYGETFRERAGDLLVVPRERGVWYDDDELGQVGMHGGLTREETLVPFASVRLSALR
jgi:hypothetical protein